MKSTLRLWSVLSCAIWLLCAAVVFAAGEYQQTRDGKTMVWNGTPKTGDTASWAGSRDSENYGTGFGSLTWYNASGKVYALYYGNMVHGKFEGAVNVHISGHTAHAYFVDGGRVSNWARGPAASTAPPAVAAVIQKKRVEAEKERAKEAQARAEAAKIAAATPAQTPNPKTESENVRPSEERVATKAPTAPPEETPPSIAEEKSETAPAPTRSASPASATFEEPPAIATPAEEKKEVAKSSSIEPLSPSEGESSELNRGEQHGAGPGEANTPAPASKREADVSLNALVGPPTSLRTTTESPSQSESESSPPEHSGPLTESEVVSLANTEARIHGYSLDNYDRPKVDHSNVKGKWSLFYPLKNPSAKSGDFAPFTITVDDKTRKVDIRK